MPSDVTLAGPKVHAERGDTADAGGGQIQAAAGHLSIQGAVRGRQLGAVDQLGKVVFRDHHGRESEWTFGDGTRWTLRCETGELLAFSHELASQLGRPTLVVEPPDPKAQLIDATRARKFDLLLLAAAIASIFIVRWLVAKAAWVGYALAILALLWLVSAAAAYLTGRQKEALGEQAPRPVAPLSKAVDRAGAVGSWFLPVCLILGALLGIAAAAERTAADAALHERQVAASAAQEAEQAQLKASQLKLRNQADVKLAQMQQAIDAQDYERALLLHDEAKAIDPNHPKLASTLQALTPKLEASRATRRKADVIAGLGLAKQVTEDRVLCESAKPVADAWSKLKQTRPDDATYEAAQKLVPKLEACRKRVVQTFAASATTARAQARQAWSAQLEQELRKRGVGAAVETGGRNAEALVVEVDRLSQDVRTLVMGGTPSLRKRAADEGFRRIRLRAGRKKRVYKLKPSGGDDVARVLEPYGLAEPLSL